MRTPLRGVVVCVACGLAAAALGAQELKAVATTRDLAGFVKRLGGEDVVVEALSSGDEDPHRIVARPSTLLKLRKADLFVQNGLDMEHAWVPALLDATRNARIAFGGEGFVDASAGTAPRDVPTTLDRSAGTDLHPKGNPHYLLDPEEARRVGRLVAAGLIRARPAAKEAVGARLRDWEQDLDRRLAAWSELAKPLKGRSVVVRHGVWNHLAARYGFTIVADLEPKPGVEPTPAHVARTIDLAKKERAFAVLAPPYAGTSLARSVAEKIGVPCLVLPVGATGVAPYEDWSAFIDATLRALVGAAGQGVAPESRPNR